MSSPRAWGCRQSWGWSSWMCCATMIFTETLQRAEPQQPTAHKERQAETVADRGVHRDSCEEEFWKLVTSCNRRTAAASPAGLQLHSRQRALIAGEGRKPCLEKHQSPNPVGALGGIGE